MLMSCSHTLSNIDNIAVCPAHDKVAKHSGLSGEQYLRFFGIFIFQIHGYLISNIFSDMKTMEKS